MAEEKTKEPGCFDILSGCFLVIFFVGLFFGLWSYTIQMHDRIEKIEQKLDIPPKGYFEFIGECFKKSQEAK